MQRRDNQVPLRTSISQAIARQKYWLLPVVPAFEHLCSSAHPTDWLEAMIGGLDLGANLQVFDGHFALIGQDFWKKAESFQLCLQLPW